MENIRIGKTEIGIRNEKIYEIRSFMCRGCGSCMAVCQEGAVSGLIHKPFKIDQAKCTGCGDCLEVCHFDAIRVR